MKGLTPQEYDALTRLDFWIFVQRVFAEVSGDTFANNFHIELLAGHLDRIRTGECRQLAIALPPRSLKSIIVSVALPAWLLGHTPETQIICASYGQDLADKLASDCRQVMQSAWYRRLFPATALAAGRQAVANFATTAGGIRIATSVGGVLTGFGADVIIVDDPMKPDEALSDAERSRANRWARHTLFTRLNDKAKGAIIIVMQRLHEDDLIGHVMQFAPFELLSFSAIAQADETHRIVTPFGTRIHHRAEGEALHPEREPLEVLAHQRVMMGSEFFAAQYLQAPTPPGGGIVKPDWFRRYDTASKPVFKRIVQSWDTASKASQLNDYSVCMTWGVTDNNDMYLLHVLRARLEYPDLRRKLLEQAGTWKANLVLIEDSASGTQLLQELSFGGMRGVTGVKAKGDKVIRMQTQTAAIEAGRVYIPREASWLSDYLHELEMFPNGRFDDQVDSTAQALAHVQTPNSFDSWKGYFKAIEEQRENEELQRIAGGRPLVRLNHPNLASQFTLCSGRVPRRGPDGSFLVAEGEFYAAMGFRGMYRVEE